MRDVAEELYASWPERLYVIGTDGRIAYKGQTGPFGFEPDEVDAWLTRNSNRAPWPPEE